MRVTLPEVRPGNDPDSQRRAIETLQQWSSETDTLNVSADYQVLGEDDLILVTTGSSDIIITMPYADDAQRKPYIVKKIDSGLGVVTISGSGSETVDGSTIKLAYKYDSASILLERETSSAVTRRNWWKLSDSRNYEPILQSSGIVSFDEVAKTVLGPVPAGEVWRVFNINVWNRSQATEIFRLTLSDDGGFGYKFKEESVATNRGTRLPAPVYLAAPFNPYHNVPWLTMEEGDFLSLQTATPIAAGSDPNVIISYYKHLTASGGVTHLGAGKARYRRLLGTCTTSLVKIIDNASDSGIYCLLDGMWFFGADSVTQSGVYTLTSPTLGHELNRARIGVDHEQPYAETNYLPSDQSQDRANIVVPPGTSFGVNVIAITTTGISYYVTFTEFRQ